MQGRSVTATVNSFSDAVKFCRYAWISRRKVSIELHRAMSQKIVNSLQIYVSKEENMCLRNAATGLLDFAGSQPQLLLLILRTTWLKVLHLNSLTTCLLLLKIWLLEASYVVRNFNPSIFLFLGLHTYRLPQVASALHVIVQSLSL